MASISEDEIQQLLRTVEMFEAITESQPEDYQSWEILKEAYGKLGRRDESLLASKKLAKAHITLGQISQAILEFEGILQEYPNDPEVLGALAELEAKTSQLSANRQLSGAPLLREDSKPTPSAPALAAGAAAPPPFRSTETETRRRQQGAGRHLDCRKTDHPASHRAVVEAHHRGSR